MSRLIKKVAKESLILQEDSLKKLNELDELIQDINLDESESEKVRNLINEVLGKIRCSADWMVALQEG